MDTENTRNEDGFIVLPAASGGGALLRRSQIAGGRANASGGAIVYLASGPSVYTTATVPQIARYLGAEVANVGHDRS